MDSLWVTQNWKKGGVDFGVEFLYFLGFGLVSSGAWKFRGSHLVRALKAAKKAGYCVDKAVLTANGEIELKFVAGVQDNSDNNTDTPNEWDTVYAAK